MKLRRSVIVIGLTGSLLFSSATPSHAVYSEAQRWRFTHYQVALMHVLFTLYAGYSPYDGFARAADPGTDECSQNRPVKLQYKTGSGWQTVAKKKTNDKAKFKASVKDRTGKYRALVPAYTSPSGYDCFKSVTKKTHKH